ncbi:unnamed protein product, partial [Mesorhabditis spiculigera]
MPGQPSTISIGGACVEDEDVDDDHAEEIWMSHLGILIMDGPEGGFFEVYCENLNRDPMPMWTLNYHEFGADRKTFSVSAEYLQRFVNFLQTSSTCAPDLHISATPKRRAQHEFEFDSEDRHFNVASLYRSFRVTSTLRLSVSSNTFLRRFEAISRINARKLCLVDEERELKDVVRCRRCRMKPWTENLWSCASCTTMWNGEGSIGSVKDVRLFSDEPLSTTDFLRMVELGFFPARPQQRGMFFKLGAKCVQNEPADPDPIDIYSFLQRLERRIVTIYNGAMDFVDKRTEEAKFLQEIIKQKKLREPPPRAYFKIRVANKNFVGGIVCEDGTKRMLILLVDQ